MNHQPPMSDDEHRFISLETNTLNFYFGPPKVEQKTSIETGCFKVIQALREVKVSKLRNGFQLNNDRVVYHDVGYKVANDYIVVEYRDWILLAD